MREKHVVPFRNHVLYVCVFVCVVLSGWQVVQEANSCTFPKTQVTRHPIRHMCLTQDPSPEPAVSLPYVLILFFLRNLTNVYYSSLHIVF